LFEFQAVSVRKCSFSYLLKVPFQAFPDGRDDFLRLCPDSVESRPRRELPQMSPVDFISSNCFIRIEVNSFEAKKTFSKKNTLSGQKECSA